MKKLSPAFWTCSLYPVTKIAIASTLMGCGGGGSGGSRLQTTQPPPGARIASVTVPESDEGTVPALFRVSLSHQPGGTVTVKWRTVDETAVAGEDYRSDRGTLVFGPDVREEIIAIEVMGDSLDEPDEDFSIVLSDPAGVSIEDGKARGRIEDDDSAPILDTSREGGKKDKVKEKREEPSRGDEDDEDDRE